MSFMDVTDGSFRPNNATKFALLLGSMLVLMGSAAVAPSLHGIQEEFGASTYLVSLVISLPSLVVAVTGFPMGYLADKIGHATVFVASLTIFLVSGVAGYFCGDIYTMLATRVFLGVGIAGIGSTATALLGLYYDGDERMRIMAVQSAFMGFGGVVLEATGGIMADVSWNTPFLIYLIAAPILIAGLMSVRNTLAGGFGSGGAEEKVSSNSKVQMAFLLASIFMLMYVMFVVPGNMSEILTDKGVSMTVCGMVIALMGLVQTIVSMLVSRMKRHPKYTLELFAAFMLQALAAFMMSMDILPVMVAGVAVLGVGMGIGMPAIVGNLSALSPPSLQGRTMGLYSCFMNLGVAVSGMTVTAVAVSYGYSSALGLVALMIFVFGLIALGFGAKFVGRASEGSDTNH